MRLRPTFVHALTAILLIASGCASEEPAARLEVEPARFELHHGGATPLRLTWNPLRELDKLQGTPTVFVHLIHPRDGTVRTFDHPYPRTWEPGGTEDYSIDVTLSALGEPLEPGAYALAIGIYDPLLGYRWPLLAGDGTEDRRAYRVAEVVLEGDSEPRFELRGAWGPATPGTTKQIVARRWLHGSGSIAVSGIERAGTVLLDVHAGVIPDAEEGLPAVALSVGGACPASGRGLPWSETDLARGGPAHLEVDIDGIDSPCTLNLTARAAAEAPGWLQLEGLAWRPADPEAPVSAGGMTP